MGAWVMIYTENNTPKIIWSELDPVYGEINTQLCEIMKIFERCLSSALTNPMKLKLDQIKKSISDVYAEIDNFGKSHKKFIATSNRWDPDYPGLLKNEENGKVVSFNEVSKICVDDCDRESKKRFSFVKNGKRKFARAGDMVPVCDLPKFVKVPILQGEMEDDYTNEGGHEQHEIEIDLNSFASNWKKRGDWKICAVYSL